MTKKYIRNRWSNEAEFRFAFENIIKLIEIGGKVESDNIKLDLTNGKLDLRGICLDGKKIKKMEFENIDFSFSSLKNSWIENSFFSKCDFNNVDFSDFSDHNNNFKECLFVGCKFNLAGIGYDGTKFIECRFENCKFVKTIFIRPEFKRVSFKNSKINNVDFNASSFEDCCFEGELKDVWFRGTFPSSSDCEYFGKPKINEMKNVSFEKAELNDLTFSDCCNLSTVKIKQSEILYNFDNWKKRLEFLMSEAQNWNSKERKETEIFANSYLIHAKNQEWQIINMNNLERDYGKGIALKIVDYLNKF